MIIKFNKINVSKAIKILENVYVLTLFITIQVTVHIKKNVLFCVISFIGFINNTFISIIYTSYCENYSNTYLKNIFKVQKKIVKLFV